MRAFGSGGVSCRQPDSRGRRSRKGNDWPHPRYHSSVPTLARRRNRGLPSYSCYDPTFHAAHYPEVSILKARGVGFRASRNYFHRTPCRDRSDEGSRSESRVRGKGTDSRSYWGGHSHQFFFRTHDCQHRRRHH